MRKRADASRQGRLDGRGCVKRAEHGQRVDGRAGERGTDIRINDGKPKYPNLKFLASGAGGL